MKAVHRLVRWLGICDGNLQEGSFRCDANVSVRRHGTALGTRCEIKNVNSFRFVEKAIDYEIERQIRALENGERIVQETRLYDAAANKTRTMRSKEDAEDYRYFPDPDLPPIRISPAEFEALRAALPELPEARRTRYLDALGLTPYDADKLTEDRTTSDYFEAVLAAALGQAKLVANWINGELAAALNEAQTDITASRITATDLAALLARIIDGSISGKIAKDVFAAMWAGEGSADAIIDTRGLRQISDSAAIGKMLDEVLAQFPEQVAQVPRRRRQAVPVPDRPGDEGNPRPGQSGPGQRAVARTIGREPLDSRPRNPRTHHVGTDLRFPRLRHHHGVSGPVQEPHPAGQGAHPERVLPGAAHAPRIRRLRRQHRLQPEAARWRPDADGHRRPGLRRLSRALRRLRHHARTRQGDRGPVHRAGLHHHRPRRQPDHRLPSRRDDAFLREPRARRARRRIRHRRTRRLRSDAAERAESSPNSASPSSSTPARPCRCSTARSWRR